MIFKDIYKDFETFKTKINKYDEIVYESDKLIFNFLYDKYFLRTFNSQFEGQITTETFKHFFKFKKNYKKLLQLNELSIKELIRSDITKNMNSKTKSDLFGGSQNIDSDIDLNNPLQNEKVGIENIGRTFIENGGSDVINPSILININKIINFPNVYELIIKDFNKLFGVFEPNIQNDINNDINKYNIDTVEIKTHSKDEEGGDNQYEVNKKINLKLVDLSLQVI